MERDGIVWKRESASSFDKSLIINSFDNNFPFFLFGCFLFLGFFSASWKNSPFFLFVFFLFFSSLLGNVTRRRPKKRGALIHQHINPSLFILHSHSHISISIPINIPYPLSPSYPPKPNPNPSFSFPDFDFFPTFLKRQREGWRDAEKKKRGGVGREKERKRSEKKSDFDTLIQKNPKRYITIPTQQGL